MSATRVVWDPVQGARYHGTIIGHQKINHCVLVDVAWDHGPHGRFVEDAFPRQLRYAGPGDEPRAGRSG